MWGSAFGCQLGTMKKLFTICVLVIVAAAQGNDGEETSFFVATEEASVQTTQGFTTMPALASDDNAEVSLTRRTAGYAGRGGNRARTTTTREIRTRQRATHLFTRRPRLLPAHSFQPRLRPKGIFAQQPWSVGVRSLPRRPSAYASLSRYQRNRQNQS